MIQPDTEWVLVERSTGQIYAAGSPGIESRGGTWVKTNAKALKKLAKQLKEAEYKLKLVRRSRDQQKKQTECFEEAYIKAERGRLEAQAALNEIQWTGKAPDIAKAAIEHISYKKKYKEAVEFLRDLYEDGCEYGDNCPRFVALNHGECLACRTRYFLEEQKED